MTDLTELQRLAEAATPGPWGVEMELDGVYAGRRTVITAPAGPQRARRIASVSQTRPHIFPAEPNIELIVAAVNALPDLISDSEALERVRALHYEVVVYELDPANGYAVYEDGERKVLSRFCAECSAGDLIDAIEDHGYRQGWDYGQQVIYPCSTIRTIDGEQPPVVR